MPPSMLVQYPRTCFLNARGVLRGASEGCFRRAEDLIRQSWSVSRRIY